MFNVRDLRAYNLLTGAKMLLRSVLDFPQNFVFLAFMMDTGVKKRAENQKFLETREKREANISIPWN
jgi:hypothetical protein